MAVIQDIQIQARAAHQVQVLATNKKLRAIDFESYYKSLKVTAKIIKAAPKLFNHAKSFNCF